MKKKLNLPTSLSYFFNLKNGCSVNQYLYVFSVFLWMQFDAIIIRSQNLTPKYQISYVQSEEIRYTITDSIGAFSIPEIVQLRNSIVEDSIIKLVYTTNDIKTTLYHKKNSKLEDWMMKPAKTVIDKNRTKIYNAQNDLVYNNLHSQSFIQNYNELKHRMTSEKEEIIPSFNYLNQNLKNQLTTSGFVVSNMGHGYLRFIKDTVELIFNNTKLVNETNLYDVNGELKVGNKEVFKVNGSGQIVPAYIIRKAWDGRFPLHCVQKLVVTSFPNYNITYYPASRSGSLETENEEDFYNKIIIYPNPADDILYIEHNSMMKSIHFEIMSSNGTIIIEKAIQDSHNNFEVSLKELTSGFYFIRIYTAEASVYKSFYKN